MTRRTIPPPPPADPLEPPSAHGPAREWVALVLAVGLATGINVITLASVVQALKSGQGLSENATQVLTTAFGGIVGVLGGFLGFKAGEASGSAAERQRQAESGA